MSERHKRKSIMPIQSNMQDETVHLKQQLLGLQNEFNDFIYTISHDLGTPLRAITNFSKLLKEKYAGTLDEKGELYLQFVIDGGEKLQTMLNGLVNYSRVNTQAKPPLPIEMSTLVGQCQGALHDKIVAAKAIICVKDKLPQVVADPDQCFSLFLALLDNALTYHAKDRQPHIQISAKDKGNKWEFLIEDNGIGIPPANMERVFHVFKRLHTDEEYPGIGMGLALAKKIVERHGGTIGFLPGTTGGATCRFTLPKALPTLKESALPKALYG
jgi:light-regulated signal transduction histidine kinase (bacteriophytochrome)